MVGEEVAPQPHDNLIRAVFSKPQHAASMLQTFLPEEVINHLDLQSTKLCQGTFVDENLRRHETDLLFSIKREARESFIYVLFEHQSTAPRTMAVRLLRYVTRIHESLDARTEVHLPIIMPIVFYNGAAPWTAPLRLSDHYDLANNILKSIPIQVIDLEYRLINLAAYSDEEIYGWTSHGNSSTVLTSRLLKHYQDERINELIDQWEQIFGRVYRESDGQSPIEVFVCYLIEAAKVDTQDLIEIIVSQTTREFETMIKTTGQRLREEGRARDERRSN